MGIFKIGRNDPCWCGSGKKYKACHEAFDQKLKDLKAQGKTIPQRLRELREEFGFWSQKTLTFRYEGREGAERMEKIMETLRKPLRDFREPLIRTAERTDYLRDETGLPKTDAAAFRLADGRKIIIRPSGTEPKLKAYLFSRGADREEAENALAELEPLVNGLCLRET